MLYKYAGTWFKKSLNPLITENAGRYDPAMRRFFVDVMKEFGSLDDLAIKAYAKKHGVGDASFERAYNSFYPTLIKGPLDTDAGLGRYADKLSKSMDVTDLDLSTIPMGKMLSNISLGGSPIAAYRSSSGKNFIINNPYSAISADVLNKNIARLHELFELQALSKNPYSQAVIIKRMKNFPMYHPFEFLGSHASMDVLKNEKRLMSSMPSYATVDSILPDVRLYTKEYELIGKPPVFDYGNAKLYASTPPTLIDRTLDKLPAFGVTGDAFSKAKFKLFDRLYGVS